MTVKEPRQILDRDPFQPVRVRLSSGDAYEIHHPDLAVVMRSRLFTALPNSDCWTLIPFLHIAPVESLGTGKDRKPRRPKQGE